MIKIKSMIKIKKLSHPMGFRGKKREIPFWGDSLPRGGRIVVRVVVIRTRQVGARSSRRVARGGDAARSFQVHRKCP